MKGARLSGLLVTGLASCCAALEAFPGAEGEKRRSRVSREVVTDHASSGFGAQATGGRGGSVYVVTNLNDTGDGSFRDAVSESHRVSATTRLMSRMRCSCRLQIVVFAVGGVINIDTRIAVKNDITIAGQTAPGDVGH